MNKKLIVTDMQRWTFDSLLNLDITKLYPQFVWHVLPYLAVQKPTRNAEGKFSAKSVLNALQKESYRFDIEDETSDWSRKQTKRTAELDGSVILALWRFFYSQKPKLWTKTPQNKAASISSGVPIVLFAYKHIHNINYNDWDRTEPELRLLLNENLAWLLNPPELPEDLPDIKQLQEEFLTTGTTGIVNPTTNPKASYVSDKRFNLLPKYQRYMYLQTWIYHPSLRAYNMITDWNDWDAVRPAHGFDDLKNLGVYSTDRHRTEELPW